MKTRPPHSFGRIRGERHVEEFDGFGNRVQELPVGIADLLRKQQDDRHDLSGRRDRRPRDAVAGPAASEDGLGHRSDGPSGKGPDLASSEILGHPDV